MSEPSTQTAAQRHVVEGRPNASFRLVVTEGPEKGKVFRVPGSTASRVLIGHSSACTLRLTDPLVSRRHASVEVRGPSLELADLGSRNGTFANEVAVTNAHLWGGEILRLGGTVMRVEVDEGLVETPLSDRTRFGRVLGASVEMRGLFPFFEQLAQKSLPVIIEGETGTGKELLAESLHEQGPRASGPFVVFDTAQIPREAVETTLFGDATKPGLFENAEGGTVLLDEVGEIDETIQKKLLRVLERGEVMRVGESTARKIDVRILATTRLDLDKLVQDGTFREDLYYRLLVSRVELPPLRKRRGDVAFLATSFWTQLGGEGEMPKALVDQLLRHEWPGNVRELKNRVARLVAFGPASSPAVETEVVVGPAENPASLYEKVLAMDLPLARAREIVVADFEKAYVKRVLEQHGGSIAKAAAASGLARRYFQLLRAKRAPRE